MNSRATTIQALKEINDVPVVVVNQDGFINFINDSFEQIFGWSKDEAMGQPLSIIIPQNLQDAHHLGFSRFITTGETKIMHTPLNLRAIHKSGEEFDAEHYIIAEQIDGDWHIGATIARD